MVAAARPQSIGQTIAVIDGFSLYLPGTRRSLSAVQEINGVLMQAFHWYTPADGSLWRELSENAEELRSAGITALWMPPASKGVGGGNDVGYGVYDLYDLGEFDQKGSVRTKYGTREEYLQCLSALRSAGVERYADCVLNHRMGGDSIERWRAVPYSQDNRLAPAGGMREIECYTGFNFPGRAGKYSAFEWHAQHFDAVDYDAANPGEHGMVYLLEGKKFDDYTALEKGNFAYLMGCDLDFQHPDVRRELINWGCWYLDQTRVDGFRLDAIKHIAAWFFPEWIDALERHAGRDLFVVGEYWWPNASVLEWYLGAVGGRMSVFDVALHYNFHVASNSGSSFDMRRVFEGSLVARRPTESVTFVENHDSQPLQALESVVEPWFKPLAYALILLRRDGYPCIFYPDYYGAEYEDFGRDGNRHRVVLPSHRFLMDVFLRARRDFCHGDQYDYFDHPNVIGWTRPAQNEEGGLAVLLSNGAAGNKWMEVRRAGTRFVDATGHVRDPITSNEQGWAEFRCNGGSVSVWVPES